LGISEFEGFLVDPTYFIDRVDNLHILETPFSSTEVDKVIRTYPTTSLLDLMVLTMSSIRSVGISLRLNLTICVGLSMGIMSASGASIHPTSP
jgi:hypothetical protein